MTLEPRCCNILLVKYNKMRLAVITDEISTDLAHALSVMREYGAFGAELRNIWNKNIADISNDEAQQAAKIVKDAGAEVVCIASPVFKCDLESDISPAPGMTHNAAEKPMEEQPNVLRRCLEIADITGAELVRVFSFWKRGKLTPEIEKRIVEELASAAEVASKYGKTLVLENEYSCYIGTGEETARVIRDVGAPNLLAAWDPANAFFAGEIPYPNGYNAVRSVTAHFHVKDAARKDTGEAHIVPVGEGQIDYYGQLKALKLDGYRGWYSLETHYAPNGGSKEDGTRICLRALIAMIEKIENDQP